MKTPNGGQYKLSVEARLTRIETFITEIRENHLPHIEQKLDTLITGSITPLEWSEHLKRTEDHERRIRKLEWMMAIGVGGLYVINILIGIWIAIHR